MNRTAIPKILLLIAVPPVLLAEEPARALPPLPGPCAELAASSDGYLYAHVRGGGLLVWHLAKEGGAWGKVPLEDVSELCRNVSGEVFARRKDGGTAAYYRLQGEEAVELVSQRTFERGEWYVDAVGRVWFQKEKDDLIILQKGKEPQVIKSQPSKYGREIRRPCEWKPEHVFLFHNTSVVLAGPEDIQVQRPARLAEEGTPEGPIRLGDHFLLSGGAITVAWGPTCSIPALSPRSTARGR